MILFLLAYIGGFLTILSPCILPVLPFVFAKSDQPFFKSSFPLLAGMAATFAGVSSLALIGGAWVSNANEWGRWFALILMAAFALSLIFPQTLEKLLQPLTNLGLKINNSQNKVASPGQSFLIGIATGLLWAPCAGPILGLILTGAATQENPASAALLLLAYALGAGTSLALALVAGGKFFGRMKKYLKAEGVVKRVLGVFVLLGVVAIAFNLDRSLLTRVARFQTESLEQSLISFVKPDAIPQKTEFGGDEGPMPDISGAVAWLNSAPLTREQLQGRVVLVDFWTYSCINCLRSLPYIKAWADKYKDSGLVVIGVHAPEFPFEKNIENVKEAIKDLGITYPVAVDNDRLIWRAFKNEYWPAHYFVDRKGRVRHHHFGEGQYAQSEKIIQMLLSEGAGDRTLPGIAKMATDTVQVELSGVSAASDYSKVRSHETYLGYQRTENLKSTPEVVRDQTIAYQAPSQFALNDWALIGDWKMGPQSSVLSSGKGRIAFKFHARDLHLVLSPNEAGKAIAFRVTIDGKAPGAIHGLDIDSDGRGQIIKNRVYQLIRQLDDVEWKDLLFEIEFMESGAEAFAFTFG